MAEYKSELQKLNDSIQETEKPVAEAWINSLGTECPGCGEGFQTDELDDIHAHGTKDVTCESCGLDFVLIYINVRIPIKDAIARIEASRGNNDED